MYYQVRHVTTYQYSEPIRENQMELRMHPRSEGSQRCWSFHISTNPRAEVATYRDARGNAVHHFDLPGAHQRLTITAESLVEVEEHEPLPAALGPESWRELERLTDQDEALEMLLPSQFAGPSELLTAFAREHSWGRRADPLTTLHTLNGLVYDRFDYAPQHTRVDSPIDHALEARKGVCQDFAHIMIALAREVGIPCRYVSGYLFHRHEDHDRSAEDASHAWVEALLPGLGWVGFDPTNNLVAGHRHIRTAIGRDYADVPPTRGVFKGEAHISAALKVAVQVAPSDAPPSIDSSAIVSSFTIPALDPASDPFELQQQGQQ